MHTRVLVAMNRGGRVVSHHRSNQARGCGRRCGVESHGRAESPGDGVTTGNPRAIAAECGMVSVHAEAPPLGRPRR